jgi:hypothetical protein
MIKHTFVDDKTMIMDKYPRPTTKGVEARPEHAGNRRARGKAEKCVPNVHPITNQSDASDKVKGGAEELLR